MRINPKYRSILEDISRYLFPCQGLFERSRIPQRYIYQGHDDVAETTEVIIKYDKNNKFASVLHKDKRRGEVKIAFSYRRDAAQSFQRNLNGLPL